MGFKDFISRGNLIQLATAVIIGAAFSNLVTAFTKGLITPLLGIFGEAPKFSEFYFQIPNRPVRFEYGQFIDALVSFLLTALVLYYCVVYPYEWYSNRNKKEEEASTRDCPECCSSIKIKASRCAFCGVAVDPVDPPPPPSDEKESPKKDNQPQSV